jgi:hypothetical protein
MDYVIIILFIILMILFLICLFLIVSILLALKNLNEIVNSLQSLEYCIEEISKRINSKNEYSSIR